MTDIQRIDSGKAAEEEERHASLTLTVIIMSIPATTITHTRGLSSANLIDTGTLTAMVTIYIETTTCLSMTIDATIVIRRTTRATLTRSHVAVEQPDMTPLTLMITGTSTRMMQSPTVDGLIDTLQSQ